MDTDNTFEAALDRDFAHERVNVFHDAASGAAGVIAIHSTALGRAMGGLRLRRYAGLDDAVGDALRLSRAMTLKNAAAGLDNGGGKAVLLDDGGWTGVQRSERLRAVGRAVDALAGAYVTAEDVGTSPEDMDVIATQTRWVAGRSTANDGRGDPSRSTARTVHGSICAAADVHLHRSLAALHVGVLGVGRVGSCLVELLRLDGACVTVTDIDQRRAEAVAARTGATVLPLAGFITADVDVLAPCAMGELLDEADVAELRCAVVAGAANNPLVADRVADVLAAADILYVPDFIANSGGIVQVAGDFASQDEGDVARRIEACIARTRATLLAARNQGRTPLAVARAMAAGRLDGARTVSLAA